MAASEAFNFAIKLKKAKQNIKLQIKANHGKHKISRICNEAL